MSDKKLTFETAMLRIEEIVSILEKNNCTLEQSLELFEEATSLCAYCNERLENAQQKVQSLVLNPNEGNCDD